SPSLPVPHPTRNRNAKRWVRLAAEHAMHCIVTSSIVRVGSAPTRQSSQRPATATLLQHVGRPVALPRPRRAGRTVPHLQHVLEVGCRESGGVQAVAVTAEPCTPHGCPLPGEREQQMACRGIPDLHLSHI